MVIVYKNNKPLAIYWFDDKHQLHRENGPAAQYAGGDYAYWIHGSYISPGQLYAIQFILK